MMIPAMRMAWSFASLIGSLLHSQLFFQRASQLGSFFNMKMLGALKLADA